MCWAVSNVMGWLDKHFLDFLLGTNRRHIFICSATTEDCFLRQTNKLLEMCGNNAPFKWSDEIYGGNKEAELCL